ncbi:uncharacterized protein F4812DRAFT_444299 [Daldinia caldariorum]|uniref:uncharacterized protein n=1 Tax=Daldinia caldariorum TaxID=326644 RepID=UPI0020088829|nr:uncharacterized protein F4812DRAFT_444299 [Daldinia caldariorum]KAI1464034.1 hypothetical protein F4812DRAFT_444299 [Daldinia caldariorum]
MSDLDFSSLSPNELSNVLNGPALQVPAGIIPNFANPQNKNTISLVALILCLVVASTSLAFRFYVGYFKLRQIHVADYLMLLAYLFWVVVIVGSLRRISQSTGLFVHQWEMRGRDMAQYLQIIFMGMCFWVVTMGLVKSSILIEWIRIFAPTDSRTIFHRSCKALLIFSAIFYTCMLVALNLSCFPYRRIWDKTVPGTCANLKVINLVATVINFILDIAVLLLPQRTIWRLKLSTIKKVGISAVFAVGVFACIAACCLLEAIVEWIKSDDMTYHYSAVALWAIAESTCGMLIFCVPVVPKVFRGLELSKRIPSIIKWLNLPISKIKRSTRSVQNTWPPTGFGLQKPRRYQSIDEPNSINLRGIESSRPTDRQYGIVCTTDITVTETYDNSPRKDRWSNQYGWLPGVRESRV